MDPRLFTNLVDNSLLGMVPDSAAGKNNVPPGPVPTLPEVNGVNVTVYGVLPVKLFAVMDPVAEMLPTTVKALATLSVFMPTALFKKRPPAALTTNWSVLVVHSALTFVDPFHIQDLSCAACAYEPAAWL